MLIRQKWSGLFFQRSPEFVPQTQTQLARQGLLPPFRQYRPQQYFHALTKRLDKPNHRFRQQVGALHTKRFSPSSRQYSFWKHSSDYRFYVLENTQRIRRHKSVTDQTRLEVTGWRKDRIWFYGSGSTARRRIAHHWCWCEWSSPHQWTDWQIYSTGKNNQWQWRSRSLVQKWT